MSGELRRRPIQALLVGWLLTRLWLAHELGWFGGVKNYEDVVLYQQWAAGMVHYGHLPSAAGWQYPVGAALLFLIPQIWAAHYDFIFCLLMLACDLGVTVTLVLVGRREDDFRGAWMWVLLISILGPLVLLRFDMAPTLALVAALGLPRRGERSRAFGTLIGAGVSIKVWPVLGLLAVRTRRDLVRVIGWCAATIVVVTGVSSIFLGNTLGWIANQSGRGLEVESVAASPWFVREAFTHRPIHYHLGSGAPEISGSLANGVASALRIAMLGLAVALLSWYVAQTRNGRGILPPRGRDAAFAAVLGYIVVSPVLSPQYLIWLVGAGALAVCSNETLMRRPMAVVGIAVVMTRYLLEHSAQYLGMSTTVTLTPTASTSLLLALRNLLLLLAACDCVRLLARSRTVPTANRGRTAAPIPATRA